MAASVANFYFDNPSNIVLAESGKPFFAGRKNCFFSASHSGSVCIVAFASCEVGIDLESTRRSRRFDEVAKRFFHNDEREALTMSVSEKHRVFYKIWTRKEAVLKMSGKGLATNLASFNALRNPVDSSDGPVHVATFQDREWMVSIAAHKPLRVKNWFSADEVIS